MTHLQAFQKKMLTQQGEAALISSEIHQRYLCGFPFSDGYLLIFQNKALVDF